MSGLRQRREWTADRNLVLFVLALLTACMAGCRAPAAPIWQVARVDDGDTVVLRKGGEVTRIRLAEIDAPERDQPFGRESRRMLTELLATGPIAVDPRGGDQFGRTLAVLYVGYTNVNEAMVARGGAWWFERYAPRNVTLAELQAGARSRRLGLWGSDEPPVPPWEWRSERNRGNAAESDRR